MRESAPAQMKTRIVPSILFIFVISISAASQQATTEQEQNTCEASSKFTIQPEKVSFPGPNGRILYGWLYTPSGKGPFPAVIWNHGSGLMDDPKLPFYRKELAALYAGHGYVFFTPHRTGHGLSRNAGVSAEESEDKECVGSDLRAVRLCKVKSHELANLDTVAAVKWLQTQRFVDKNRIAVSGSSYGGIQTILTSEKEHGIRAFIPFTPAAMSWANVQLRERLLSALEKAKAPMFLIQAGGDYSTGPYELLGTYLTRKGGLNRAKLYPKFGTTQQDAHGRFSLRCDGIEIWGKDVLDFLKAAMK
jgi:dienelactone hydrolase